MENLMTPEYKYERESTWLGFTVKDMNLKIMIKRGSDHWRQYNDLSYLKSLRINNDKAKKFVTNLGKKEFLVDYKRTIRRVIDVKVAYFSWSNYVQVKLARLDDSKKDSWVDLYSVEMNEFKEKEGFKINAEYIETKMLEKGFSSKPSKIYSDWFGVELEQGAFVYFVASNYKMVFGEIVGFRIRDYDDDEIIVKIFRTDVSGYKNSKNSKNKLGLKNMYITSAKNIGDRGGIILNDDEMVQRLLRV